MCQTLCQQISSKPFIDLQNVLQRAVTDPENIFRKYFTTSGDWWDYYSGWKWDKFSLLAVSDTSCVIWPPEITETRRTAEQTDKDCPASADNNSTVNNIYRLGHYIFTVLQYLLDSGRKGYSFKTSTAIIDRSQNKHTTWLTLNCPKPKDP